MTCALCSDPAVAVFAFSHGCLCNPATVQSLCAQHAFKSWPAGGGSKVLIEDLTLDAAFTKAWSECHE